MCHFGRNGVCLAVGFGSLRPNAAFWHLGGLDGRNEIMLFFEVQRSDEAAFVQPIIY